MSTGPPLSHLGTLKLAFNRHDAGHLHPTPGGRTDHGSLLVWTHQPGRTTFQRGSTCSNLSRCTLAQGCSSSQSAELTNAECRAAAPRLLAKFVRDRPLFVCFVGMGIFEHVSSILSLLCHVRSHNSGGIAVLGSYPGSAASARQVSEDEDEKRLQERVLPLAFDLDISAPRRFRNQESGRRAKDLHRRGSLHLRSRQTISGRSSSRHFFGLC